MSGLGEEVKREKESLRGKAPSLRSPIAEAVIQAYADGYTAGSLRQPSDAEVDAALRYLLRQGLLREGITIMAAKFAVSGMCSAMAEALERRNHDKGAIHEAKPHAQHHRHERQSHADRERQNGCVDIVFADDETAMAVRDAITAEHPFEPTEPSASAQSPDAKEMRELLSELEDKLNKAMYIDLMSHRRDMGDVQFNLGRVAAYSNAVSCCKSSLMLMDQRDGTEDKS